MIYGVLDELKRSHKTKLQKKPMLRAMFLFEYRFLKGLQEPKNRYRITLDVFLSNTELDPILEKYQRLGLIKKVENDPNKYINTQKGNYTFYLITQLNSLLDKYITIEL